MKKYLLLLSISFLLINGCDVQKQAQEEEKKRQDEMQKMADSWMGAPKYQLIQSWGPPGGGTTSDGQTGEILLYNNNHTVYFPIGYAMVQKEINNYIQVFCHADGTIYYMRWGGQ